jgi:hypothetical protein
MRHLAFVALAFATCLPASRAAAAAESKMPSLELTAHHGEMYAARTYIDVDVEGTYFAESGRLDPGIHIDLEFKGPCSEWGCNSRSVSHTYNDIAPLVETLRGAQPHFVDGTPYTHAFKSDPRSRDFMEGTATIDATTKRLRVLFDKDVEVTFDADEVAYFLGMLDSAQAQLMQIRPQIDAFNAARAFLEPPPPAIRRDSRMSDSRPEGRPRRRACARRENGHLRAIRRCGGHAAGEAGRGVGGHGPGGLQDPHRRHRGRTRAVSGQPKR